jgi:hypothetical protein
LLREFCNFVLLFPLISDSIIICSLLNSTPSGLAKLTKASTSGGPLKQQQGEKKETPQERLKRIMSKQLNKQSMT